LLATLKANEGRMIKTVANKSLNSIKFRGELSPSGLWGAVKIIEIPMIPKTIDAHINTRVDIFCMVLVYHADDLGS
jgi:hypothetical protein